MPNVVNWFEIPVEQMDRAKAFYSAVLGRALDDMPAGPDLEMAAFPWEEGSPNAAGALVRQDGRKPSADGTLVYFQCDDVAVELDRVASAGGMVVMPKTSIGEWGNIGLLRDTEGNVIGLHSQR